MSLQSGLLRLMHPYALAKSPFRSFRLRVSREGEEGTRLSLRFELAAVLQLPDAALGEKTLQRRALHCCLGSSLHGLLEALCLLRRARVCAEGRFSLPTLFSHVPSPLKAPPTLVSSSASREEIQRAAEEETQSQASLRRDSDGRLRLCSAATSSVWFLRVFHPSQKEEASLSQLAAEAASEVAAGLMSSNSTAADFAAFHVDENSTLLAFPLRELSPTEDHDPPQRTAQNGGLRLEDFLGFKWMTLLEDSKGVHVDRQILSGGGEGLNRLRGLKCSLRSVAVVFFGRHWRRQRLFSACDFQGSTDCVSRTRGERPPPCVSPI